MFIQVYTYYIHSIFKLGTNNLFFKLTQKLSVHCQGGKPDTGKFHSSYIGMNVCGSAYENGCVVNGTCATAAD